MINLNFIIIGLAVAISIYFAIYNIIKRFRYLENKLFALACLLCAAMFSLNIFQKLFYSSINLTILSRIFFSLLILICQCVAAIIQIFPRWEKRPGLIFILIPQITGLLLIGLTLSTDLIISTTVFKNNMVYTFGPLATLYIVILGLYLVGIFVTFLYKPKQFQNESFKIQLLPFQFGLLFGTIIIIIFYLILPFYFKIFENKHAGILGGIFLQLVINYSLSHERQIDFKRFYLKVSLWSFFIIILYLPAYWLIKLLLNSKILYDNISLAIGSIVIPLSFIIIYRILRPVIEKLANKKDETLQNIFTKIFLNISELSDMRTQKIDWDVFFQKGINSVCEILNINKAAFFMLNEETKIYELLHKYNENSETSDISENDPAIISIKNNNQILEKSFLYTDKTFEEHKDVLLNFFNSNNIEIALPIFLYKGKLVGLLLLGKLSGNKNYSIDFISFLESYRIQFSALLENLIFSEEIRKTQVVKRDKMFVKNIKKKIIPTNFIDLEGLKISSLFINNSDFGGDFFNSVKVGGDKAGIYIANTSDIGVESALLTLEINGVFHAQAESHESPESLLNIINQVLCSSRFAERYATAFYIIYNVSSREISFSNAAFNPMVIFDPKKDDFLEFDSEGIPIGIDIGFHYRHKTIIAPTDGIGLCYSHGVSSAIDKNGNNYSINRIKDIIKINKDDSPAALIRKIYADFKNFIQDSKLFSDITLIVFRTA